MEQQGTSEAEETPRTWRPSGRPDRASSAGGAPTIVERTRPVGRFQRLGAFLRRPIVKVMLGMMLFVSAALVYEATVNNGSWTMKADPRKATKHRGLKAIPKTPG